MSTGVVIFSRMDSRRLPGKALRDIAGRPLLGRVIDRANRCTRADVVIVATSDRPDDDAIADFALAEGSQLFRGDLDDVLGRALSCCNAYGLTRFARVCGDRPFFDPATVDRLIAEHAANGLDLATTLCPRSYPPGLTVEIVGTDALRHADASATEAKEREHFTQYFYRRSGDFKIRSFEAIEELDFSDLAFAVDDESDLRRAAWVASRLSGNGASAEMAEVVSIYRKAAD